MGQFHVSMHRAADILPRMALLCNITSVSICFSSFLTKQASDGNSDSCTRERLNQFREEALQSMMLLKIEMLLKQEIDLQDPLAKQAIQSTFTGHNTAESS